MDHKNQMTYFAKTSYRNQQQLFGIKQEDRLLHTYIIGTDTPKWLALFEPKYQKSLSYGRIRFF